jgi:DNA-binding CsgD family transcriptional regulator
VYSVRQRQKEQRRLATLARTYETTGDIARDRFVYAEATTQFEHALAQSSTVEDEVRLCEKIGRSIFYSARPDLATPWFERAVESCLSTESLREKAPAIMLPLTTQYWLESRTVDSVICAKRARELAVLSSNTARENTSVAGAQRRNTEEREALIRHIDVLIANQLVLLGRYDEAAPLISADHEPGKDAPLARSSYLNQRAILYATRGYAERAFADFDLALESAKERSSGYMTTVIWDDYANWAMALGRLDIARACRERALLVARERRILWRIPYLTLRFASMLITVGDYEHARDLLIDAMTYDTETPAVRVLKTIAAVELAHTIGDIELLKRVFDEEVLEYAFRSGEPERISPIVAAYVKVMIARGQIRRAKKLLARGISAIHQADHTGDLLALAARYGSSAEAARARHILLERMRLPHHRVAQAYLELWETQAALRRRAMSTAREYGEKAARSFGRLGWKHQQEETLVLIGASRPVGEPGNSASRISILSDLTPVLTDREQQVAELVLRGLTNRTIAEMLSISEHTVESHMTSIFNRLGLRSRWQLMDLSK